MAEYFLDYVGRRRKLSQGAMLNIQKQFREGVSTGDLAEQYGVSKTTVLAVCYNTPRQRDIDRMLEARRDHT